jgi:hypothetical protein
MIKNSITYAEIKEDFENRNIPIDSPGFYDHPNFLLIEEKNASYLSNYAKFVNDRPREASYDEFVKKTVPLVAATYHEKLIAQDKMVTSVDISNLISKALDRIGIWNYVVKGSITVDFPSASDIAKRHFWSIDYDGFKTDIGWVVAPPFYVVDVTLKLQDFSKAETEHLVSINCAEANSIIEPDIEDIMTPDACSLLASHNLPQSKYFDVISPQTGHFIKVFPAREVLSGDTQIKYIPLSVSASDLPFEQMTSIKFDGQTGYEIFENEISNLIENP